MDDSIPTTQKTDKAAVVNDKGEGSTSELAEVGKKMPRQKHSHLSMSICLGKLHQQAEYDKLIKEPRSFQENTTFTCLYGTYASKVYIGAPSMSDKSTFYVQEKPTFMQPYGTYSSKVYTRAPPMRKSKRFWVHDVEPAPQAL